MQELFNCLDKPYVETKREKALRELKKELDWINVNKARIEFLIKHIDWCFEK